MRQVAILFVFHINSAMPEPQCLQDRTTAYRLLVRLNPLAFAFGAADAVGWCLFLFFEPRET
jgi:hypothetical protein